MAEEGPSSTEKAALLSGFLAGFRKQPEAGEPEAADGAMRSGDGVHVHSKALVMQVLHDPAGNYSATGYNERAEQGFGRIYLGLDKGAEYARQSTKVNAAIERISAAEGFVLALQEARNVLAGNPAADEEVVVDEALAAICRLWFDLPDGVNMEGGGLRYLAWPPACCPGHFIFSSGYIFYPDPPFPINLIGPSQGALLKSAVIGYVAGLRGSGRLPSGVLSRAVFEAFPSGEDDLIARTIVGVMIGMVPTVKYNLKNTLDAWKDGTFAELQRRLKQHGGTDPYIRASEVLTRPLMQAMQLNPMPPAVWRRAVRDHALGPVQVRQGEKIHVEIASATKEDHDAGIADVFPIFGGDRRTTPHPTHACPGYHAAVGIMLGVLNGLMEPT